MNIWTDKDKHGIGEKKANEVAAVYGCYVNPPPLTIEQMDKSLSDWNDYLIARGDLRNE